MAPSRPGRAVLVDDFGRHRVAVVLLRSSYSGGLRYRLPLDRLHDRQEVRDCVLSVLAREGIEVRDGEVEVWPNGNRSARLPLGVQSCLIDPEDLEPQVDCGSDSAEFLGLRRRGGKLVRDVPALVRAWAGLVETKRLPLDAIVGTTPLVIPVSHSLREKKKREEGDDAARATSPEDGENPSDEASSSGGSSPWANRIAELERNGAPRHGRFAALRDLVFHWRVTLDLPSPEVIRRLKRWLNHAPHSSRDLTGPNAAQHRAQALGEAKGRLRSLDRQTAVGKLRPHKPSPTAVPLLSTKPVREQHGTRWRAVLAAELCPEDRALVADEPDPWLQGCLAVLLALVRRIERDHPDATTIAVPSTVLKTIAGGRRRCDGTGSLRCGYVVLRERAVALGILGAVAAKHSKKRGIATVRELPQCRGVQAPEKSGFADPGARGLPFCSLPGPLPASSRTTRLADSSRPRQVGDPAVGADR